MFYEIIFPYLMFKNIVGNIRYNQKFLAEIIRFQIMLKRTKSFELRFQSVKNQKLHQNIFKRRLIDE